MFSNTARTRGGMNKRALRAMDGRVVHLLPAVQRRQPNGDWLPTLDDEWRIETFSVVPPVVVRLNNLATGHFVDVYPDGVLEFRYPDSLVLREQLTIRGLKILRTPLPHPSLAYLPYPAPR